MSRIEEAVQSTATSAFVLRRSRAGSRSTLIRSFLGSPRITPRSWPARLGETSVAPTTCRPSVPRSRRATPCPMGPRPLTTTRKLRAMLTFLARAAPGVLAFHRQGRYLFLGLDGHDDRGRDGEEGRVTLARGLQQHLVEPVGGDPYQLALGHLGAQGVGQDLAVDPDRGLALDHGYSSLRVFRTISRPRSASATDRLRGGRKRIDCTPQVRRSRPFASRASWAFARKSGAGRSKAIISPRPRAFCSLPKDARSSSRRPLSR